MLRVKSSREKNEHTAKFSANSWGRAYETRPRFFKFIFPSHHLKVGGRVSRIFYSSAFVRSFDCSRELSVSISGNFMGIFDAECLSFLRQCCSYQPEEDFLTGENFFDSTVDLRLVDVVSLWRFKKYRKRKSRGKKGNLFHFNNSCSAFHRNVVFDYFFLIYFISKSAWGFLILIIQLKVDCKKRWKVFNYWNFWKPVTENCYYVIIVIMDGELNFKQILKLELFFLSMKIITLNFHKTVSSTTFHVNENKKKSFVIAFILSTISWHIKM